MPSDRNSNSGTSAMRWRWAQLLRISNSFQMRIFILISLLTFLNIGCESEPPQFDLHDTNWKFVSLRYDSNYAWDTFETFTDQLINRIIFTRDSLFIIKNDSSRSSGKYSINSSTLTINYGKTTTKLSIRKLTKDTISLHDTFGVTYGFRRNWSLVNNRT